MKLICSFLVVFCAISLAVELVNGDNADTLVESRAWRQCLKTYSENGTNYQASACLMAKQQTKLTCFPLSNLFMGISIPLDQIFVTATECDSLPRGKNNCNRLPQLKKKDYTFDAASQTVCVDADVDNICKLKSSSCSRFYDVEVPTSKCDPKSTTASILVAKSSKSLQGYNGNCKISYKPNPIFDLFDQSNVASYTSYNGYTETLGTRFKVDFPISVTSLGVYCDPSTPANYASQAGIWQSNTQTLLTTKTVHFKPCPQPEYQYVDISPITLQPNVEYKLAAYGDDSYYYPEVESVATVDGITIIGSTWTIAQGFQYPVTGSSYLYPQASLKYQRL